MTIAEFSRRMELHFWDLAIPALSASPLLRQGLKSIYLLNQKTKPFRWHLLTPVFLVFGYFNGLILYQLFQLFAR